MTVSTLSGHRRVAPYGMAGGPPGALGGQPGAERADGTVAQMAGMDSRSMVRPGDVLAIDSPGGGGYGEPAG